MGVKCPYCGIMYHSSPTRSTISDNYYKPTKWRIDYEVCPNCNNEIIHIAHPVSSSQPRVYEEGRVLVIPISSSRGSIPPEVPSQISKDYTEAANCLKFSPNASAALARRCFQNLIRTKEGIREKNLYLEIQKVLEKNSMPQYLAERLNTIRRFGNIAAHPERESATGEIIDVEPHEAEFVLDTIDLLFTFYYLEPARAAAMSEAADAKTNTCSKSQ